MGIPLSDINLGANAPSVTELGYVKGVTSAIQTQFTGLSNASATGTDPGHAHSPKGEATSRLQTAADATSITPTADSIDYVYQANAQGAGTLTLVNPTGTPVNGQKLRVVINATNGAQTMAWGNLYLASTDVALPATVAAGKIVELGFTYIINKWYLVALTNIV